MAHPPLISSDVRPTPSTQHTRTPRATTKTAAQHHSCRRAGTRQPTTFPLRGTSPRPTVTAGVAPSHRTEPSLPAADKVHTDAA
jgi:hypothetical protein